MNYFFAKFIDKLHFTIKEKAKKIKYQLKIKGEFFQDGVPCNLNNLQDTA